MAKVGRPTKYTQEIADALCAQLAQGDSLRTVCKPAEMPSVVTVFTWFRLYPDFLNQYTRAKEEAADALTDEMLDIADDATNDWMVAHRKDGSEAWQLNGEHVQRSRLRIETRKWLASKLKPKKYGEKLDLTTKGEKLPTPIMGGASVPSDDSNQENTGA